MTAVHPAYNPMEFCADWDSLKAQGLTDEQIAARYTAGTRSCSAQDCTEKHYAKGLCSKHYEQAAAARARRIIPYPTNSSLAAAQAETDALTMAVEVRDLDPTAVWQRISGWDETRLATAFIAAVALIPIDRTVDELKAWCIGLDPE